MNSQQTTYQPTDKREIAARFRERMALLLSRQGFNLSQFSQAIGVDRSALSQFLMPEATRLPRAETLFNIAQFCGVSVDWLLGVVATEGEQEDSIPSVETLRMSGEQAQKKLAQWHREAQGYKIRYIPSTIPDLLRTPEVSDYEFKDHNLEIREAQDKQARELLDKTPFPETDIEVCMPLQTLEHLARGEGIWSDLAAPIRRHQLEHMHALVEAFYPTYRLFLYDQHTAFSAPYTLFGPQRAIIYLGNMYLIVHSVEHIRAMTQHFDRLIKGAEVPPDRAAKQIEGYLAEMK